MSLVGDDALGGEIVASVKSWGLPTRGIKVCKGHATPTVACCFDNIGNLSSGVADTGTIETLLDEQWVSQFRGDIANARVVLLEGNLSPGVLGSCATMASEAGVPVFYEPVSVSKAIRIVPFLPHVSHSSP